MGLVKEITTYRRGYISSVDSAPSQSVASDRGDKCRSRTGSVLWRSRWSE
jgi:hypothetical protein